MTFVIIPHSIGRIFGAYRVNVIMENGIITPNEQPNGFKYTDVDSPGDSCGIKRDLLRNSKGVP